MAVKVRQRGDAWWIFVDHKGKRKAKKIGTKSAAQQVKAKIEREIALGAFGIADAKIPTLGDYAETWMTTVRARHRPGTAVRYQGQLDQHILPILGAKRIDEISRQDVKRLIAAVEKKHLSPATVKHVICVLRICLSAAVEDEVITSNSARNPGKLLPKGKSRQVADWYQPHELHLMLQSIKRLCPDQYELFSLLSFSGMRVGEALGLQWGDIDLNGNFLMVRRSRNLYGTERPKTDRERRVDFSNDMATILRGLYARMAEQALARGSGTVPEIVFVNHKGEPISSSFLRKIFPKALKAAGLRHIRIHDLRHSYASNLLQAGAPIQFVSRQLGHASIKMTVDVYGHLLPGGHSDVLNQYHNAVNTQQIATHTQPALLSA